MISILGSLPKFIPRFTSQSIVRLSPRHCCIKQSPPCVGKAEPPINFECKIAVISGGTSGIGLAIAHELLIEKAQHVVLLSSNACRGREAVNILNCCYGKGKAIFFRCDVQCKNQVTECYDRIMKEYKKIDILVNSAGIFDGCNWEKEINISLVGTINNMLQAYKAMGHGSVILNVCGIYGLDPLYTAPTLSAAHYGIIGLSKSFGAQRNVQRNGVRVVTLCTDVTNTSFTKNAGKRAMYNEWRNELDMFLSKAKRQNADVCGKAAIQLLQKAISGTIWVITGSKLYSLNIPHWKSYRNLESQII